MQFSDYQHPEWCEEKKFTKVEITSEVSCPLTTDVAITTAVIDGSKEINREQFAAFCNYFNDNLNAIKTATEFFIPNVGAGAMTNMSNTISKDNYPASSIFLYATPEKDTISVHLGHETNSEVGGTFVISSKEIAYKNKTIPAYKWASLQVPFAEIARGKELSEIDVELIDYKLILEMSPVDDTASFKEDHASDMSDPEMAGIIQNFIATYDPLNERIATLNVYGISQGETKEPVFNFTTNCNLFIDNMR